jgi:predicted RNase H-like HicB family nuclease
MTARYEVKLFYCDEGYAVWCPSLPGCVSQGVTEEEALENIKDAIREYLSVRDEAEEGEQSRMVEVEVG